MLMVPRHFVLYIVNGKCSSIFVTRSTSKIEMTHDSELSLRSVSGQRACIRFPDCAAVALICVFCKFKKNYIGKYFFR